MPTLHRVLPYSLIIIGERAKRARHSLVCSIENRGYIIQYRPKVMQQFKNCTKITTVKTKWLDIIIISLKYIQKLVILVFEWVSLVLVNRYIINKTVAKQNDSVAM